VAAVHEVLGSLALETPVYCQLLPRLWLTAQCNCISEYKIGS